MVICLTKLEPCTVMSDVMLLLPQTVQRKKGNQVKKKLFILYKCPFSVVE